MQDKYMVIVIVLIILVLGYTFYQYKDNMIAHFSPGTKNGVLSPMEAIQKIKEESRTSLTTVKDKAEEAEKHIWDFYGPSNTHDIQANIGNPGMEMAQSQYDPPDDDYMETLKQTALEDSVTDNHKQWAKKMGSQTKHALIIDDLDEAVEMNLRKGWGMNTFKKPYQNSKNNPNIDHL
uniref:Uncharacterized protein n=1 Tax=Abalone asfa-like virus TaxID=2839893 RepID=A0A5K7XWZ9_9VIRU|nr:hypothetical protein [Abalone asfa-like virus]BCY04579.1 hypothetical protein [Abalone asfa-like virus]